MKILTLIKPGNENHYVLEYAKQLAKVPGFQLYFLNVIPVSGDIPRYADGTVMDNCTEFDLSQFKQEQANNERYFKSLDWPGGINCLIGDPVSIVKDKIATEKISLILSGSHLTTKMEDWFVSSFSARIMEKTELPCLFVKAGTDFHFPKRIAYIGDFTSPAKQPLEALQYLKKLCNSSVSLFRINTPQSFQPQSVILQNMAVFALINDLGIVKKEIYSEYSKKEGIKKLIENYELDLIFIGKLKQSFPDTALNGSLKKDAVNHISTPVCIL